MAAALRDTLLAEAASGRLHVVGLTVDQFDWMVNHGVIPEDPTTELIGGLIVQKDRSKLGEDPMTIGDRHRMAVLRLAALAPKFEMCGCFLQSQQPVALPPDDEPEPDISVIRGTIEEYVDRKPGPLDVVFVLEVADSSLKRDLSTKLRVYARAGIEIYIVVNLQADVVLLHRRPVADAYAEVMELGRSAVLELPTATEAVVPVSASLVL